MKVHIGTEKSLHWYARDSILREARHHAREPLERCALARRAVRPAFRPAFVRSREARFGSAPRDSSSVRGALQTVPDKLKLFAG